MSYGVVILAGGDGRRMGGGKPLRLLGGRALIEHAVGQASRWSADIAISVRHKDDLPVRTGIPFVEDRIENGPISGVAAALAFAAQRRLLGVLTIPCDTPFLPANLLDRLSGADAAAAVSRSGGRIHPSCTLWRGDLQTQLAGYLEEGRSSLKAFAARVGMTEVEWPLEPYDPFFNVNSPQDLKTAEEILKTP